VVGGGSGVQVGSGVGAATCGPGKATMIKLMTMLTAIIPLMIKTTVWLKLRFWLLRRRLLTRTFLLERDMQSRLGCQSLNCHHTFGFCPGLYHRWVPAQLAKEAKQVHPLALAVR
jgi:hypothetical protein